MHRKHAVYRWQLAFERCQRGVARSTTAVSGHGSRHADPRSLGCLPPALAFFHTNGITKHPKRTRQDAADTQAPTSAVSGLKRNLTWCSPEGTTTARCVTFAR